MKTLLVVAIIPVLGYGALVAALYLLQSRLIFYPQPPGRAPAGDLVQGISVQRGEATLHGWIVNPDRPGPLLVYFGGNAEETSRLTDTFARLPATSVLINYRGYGNSTGRPSAAALIGDAEAVVQTAQDRFGRGRPLIVFGRSLGSGIAALATRHASVDGLILQSPYRSLTHVARRLMPLIPVELLLEHRIDTTAALDALPRRTLVLYADDDVIVPTAESQALTALVRPPPHVVIFEGGHNLPLHHPALWPAVESFVRSFAH